MLLRQLMPATPINPGTGVSIALLSYIKTMQMVGQVSIYGWVTVLNNEKFFYDEKNPVSHNVQIYSMY